VLNGGSSLLTWCDCTRGLRHEHRW